MSARLAGSVVRYPARASFISFIFLIALGAILLLQPYARPEGREPIGLMEAIFTSTSAVCVTGLTVLSTGQDFSFAGQVTLLVLIQLGGIGIMTITTLITVGFGRRGLRERATIAETLGFNDVLNPGQILRQVLLTCFVLEGLGFVALFGDNLFLLWREKGELAAETVAGAAWQALFHSVSAYCNAGVSLFDDNMIRYQGNVVHLSVIGTLIILGGIGFPVLLDFRHQLRHGWDGLWARLSLHSKLMIVGTASLLLLGTAAVLFLEWGNTLDRMPFWKKLLNAWFMGVVPRTAGFNSVAMPALTNGCLFIFVLLMMVGAGPCSTGGGFKVSTFMILVLRAWNSFRGRHRIHIFRRSIPTRIEDRATTVSLIYAATATLALTLLLVFEQSLFTESSSSKAQFLEGLFEVISALGTAGLSTGITAKLTVASQWVLILCMFVGRVGPISVAAVLSRAEEEARVEYASEETLIG